MLSDREARSTTFGLENPLSTRFWTAVKTGTSADMGQLVWIFRQCTVGVWVGNFSGRAMWNVSGITGAAPIWIELMNRVHQNGSSHTRGKIPSGIISANVDFSGIEPQRAEWFIKGTELKNVMPARMAGNARIIYPAQGTIIALDPDIPDGQERVLFEADDRGNETEWDLNGYNLGSGRIVSWAPEEGKYVLSIIPAKKSG
jgi:penicillin-binding protein 1C